MSSAYVTSLDDEHRAKLLAAMPGLKERAKTLVELLDGAAFLFAERPLALDEKAAAILAEGRQHISALLPRLNALDDWSAAAIEARVRAYADESHAKLGQIAQPLRAALTGRSVSPGVFDVADVLGGPRASPGCGIKRFLSFDEGHVSGLAQ